MAQQSALFEDRFEAASRQGERQGQGRPALAPCRRNFVDLPIGKVRNFGEGPRILKRAPPCVGGVRRRRSRPGVVRISPQSPTCGVERLRGRRQFALAGRYRGTETPAPTVRPSACEVLSSPLVHVASVQAPRRTGVRRGLRNATVKSQPGAKDQAGRRCGLLTMPWRLAILAVRLLEDRYTPRGGGVMEGWRDPQAASDVASLPSTIAAMTMTTVKHSTDAAEH